MAELNTNNPEDPSSIRRSKGISLKQISDETKIPVRFLQAIDNRHFDLLPGGIYTVSYVRQYAEVVGISPSEIFPSNREDFGN